MNEKLRSIIETKLEKGLHLIPYHMHDGLKLYLLRGVEPGGFLYCVLSNDMKGSFARADHINQVSMQNWADICVNYLPSEAQGSSEKVEKWMKFASTNKE